VRDTDPDRVRVLHVDDDPEFRRLAVASLEREDDRLSVTTAPDAAAALERLDADPLDCVVSDYEMPGRDGIELLEAVRERFPRLPFLLFTGAGSERVASEAISAGVTDYLRKGTGADRFALLANRVLNAVEAERSRAALEERNRRLELLAGTVPGVVYRCRADPERSVEFLAGECERLTGYPARAFESGERSWGQLIHPEDRAATRETVAEALGDGGGFETTYRVRTADGDTRLLWERGTATRDGAVEGFVTDVTDRKRREAELERYERILEASGDPVYTLDSEGRLAFVNDALVEMTGHEPAELLGEHVSAIMDEADIERAEALIQSLLAGDRDRGTVEATIHTADGEQVPCEAHVSLRPGEGFQGTVGVVRDISERVERERKLERIRDRTQALMYTESREGTAQVATDAANEVIGAPLSGVHLLNEAGDALVPTAVADTVGAAFDEPPVYPRDARPGSRAALVWEAFGTGEPLRVSHTDGFDRLAEDTPAGSVVVYPVGEHGVFIISAAEPDSFDDTDEALVEILATGLETAIDRVEREAELRAQRDALRRERDRLEQFTGVVSHDLRNPLNVAGARLALAREECDSDHLDGVEQAHRRMDELIEDVLALAREGDTVTDPEPVELSRQARNCWAHVETEAASLVVDGDRRLRADPGRLKRLLENLLGNAAQHGGSRVTVGDLPDGFYVADDGPGVPPEQRDSVFEAGHSAAGGGPGMGLAIVEQIADAHGWSVAVAESDDGGARFEITGVER